MFSKIFYLYIYLVNLRWKINALFAQSATVDYLECCPFLNLDFYNYMSDCKMVAIFGNVTLRNTNICIVTVYKCTLDSVLIQFYYSCLYWKFMDVNSVALACLLAWNMRHLLSEYLSSGVSGKNAALETKLW